MTLEYNDDDVDEYVDNVDDVDDDRDDDACVHVGCVVVLLAGWHVWLDAHSLELSLSLVVSHYLS